MRSVLAGLSLVLVISAAAFGQVKPDMHPAFPTSDGEEIIEFDFTGAPDLQEWGVTKVAPALQEWYPKIIKLLPSPHFHAAKVVHVSFKETMDAAAVTSGNQITANASYFRSHPKDVNALVHEATHVVQAYGGVNAPSWLVEGLDDFIRFYIVEPETHGADIAPRRVASVRYDGSYRITANFLHWVVGQTDGSFPRKLNAAVREGRYSDETWVKLAGKPVAQLGAEWKQSLVQAK